MASARFFEARFAHPFPHMSHIKTAMPFIKDSAIDCLINYKVIAKLLEST
jgi:hypothetical protein